MAKRLIAVLVIASVALGAFLVARGESVAVTYWVIDDHTLGIQVIHGPRSSCAISQIRETATEVAIHAECRSPFPSLGGNSAGYPYEFVVTLQAALASRAVVDEEGQPAILCVAVRCGMGTP